MRHLTEKEGIKHGHHGYDGEVDIRTAGDYVLIRISLHSAEAILPVASKINQVRPSSISERGRRSDTQRVSRSALAGC